MKNIYIFKTDKLGATSIDLVAKNKETIMNELNRSGWQFSETHGAWIIKEDKTPIIFGYIVESKLMNS